jgi:hypothetical protein
VGRFADFSLHTQVPRSKDKWQENGRRRQLCFASGRLSHETKTWGKMFFSSTIPEIVY